MKIRLFDGAPLLSRLCMGTSTFAREIDQMAAFQLLDHAYERQITLIDTAATYSSGASEMVVGAWLSSRRPDPARLMVATKIYPPYTPAAIDAAVKASTERLGVAIIDVLYLHKWDKDAESPDTLQALDGLITAGRVRCLGVSNFTTEQLSTVLELQSHLGLRTFAILQNNNNLALRDVDGALVALCQKFGVALVTYSPLGAGFLTGKHRGGVTPGSRFDVAPGHQAIYFQPTATRRLDLLEAVATRAGVPLPHLALAWAIHRPGVASVLIGGRVPAHLDQAFAALAFNDPKLFAAVEAE